MMIRQKILIADNEPKFVEKAKKYLDSYYEIKVAHSKDDGLDKVKKESPALVIVGYLEPRGDSFRLHQALKENQKTTQIPLLVVDVRPEEHSRKGWRKNEGIQMDAEGYLSRPVDPAVLMEEIERCLANASLKKIEQARSIKQMEFVLSRQMEKWEKVKDKTLVHVH